MKNYIYFDNISELLKQDKNVLLKNVFDQIKSLPTLEPITNRIQSEWEDNLKKRIESNNA